MLKAHTHVPPTAGTMVDLLLNVCDRIQTVGRTRGLLAGRDQLLTRIAER